MNTLIEKLFENLLQVSVQASILIALIFLVSLFAKKTSSEFRYWLWCIVLFWLCVPVSFNLPFLPSLKSGDLIKSNYSRVYEPVKNQSVTMNNSMNSVALAPKIDNEKIPSESVNTKSNKLNVKEILVLFWFSGMLIITIITIRRNIIIFRKLKKCPAVERKDLNVLLGNLCRRLGITKKVSLHYMDLSVVSGPAASGIIKPKVFLPPVIADSWSVTDAEPVILHELAHIKRNDIFVNLLQMIIQSVYFFHPLVWFVNGRIKHLREETCDDTAIKGLEGEIHRYSKSILNVIVILKNEKSFGLAGFGFAELKNSLGKRIKRILNENYRVNQRMTLVNFTALVLIGFFGIAVAGGHKPENLTDIIITAEKGDNLIKSGMGDFTSETVLVDSASYRQHLKMENLNELTKLRTNGRGFTKAKNYDLTKTFLLKGIKLRINQESSTPVITKIDTGKSYKGKMQKTWDGLKCETLEDKTIMKIGVIRTQLNMPTMFYDPKYSGYNIFGIPVAKFLKGENFPVAIYFEQMENMNIEKVSYVGEKKVDGIVCSVFKCYDKSTGITLKFWLGKSILFRPKHVEVLSSKNKIIIDNTFKKFNDGIIFPKKTIAKTYYIVNKKETLLSVNTITVNDNYKLNIDVPDTLFKIKFPKGLAVVDERTFKNYIFK